MGSKADKQMVSAGAMSNLQDVTSKWLWVSLKGHENWQKWKLLDNSQRHNFHLLFSTKLALF